ncbi:MAG: hydantoinase B/oxoprolinase family protein [Thermomicrobiales bacterium]
MNGRTSTCQRVVDLIHGRWPRRFPTGSSRRATGECHRELLSSGVDPRTGQYYVYPETIGGGFGARATAIKRLMVQVHVTNTGNRRWSAFGVEHPRGGAVRVGG